jgi:pyruvate/2-oxoglutarate dehydrogenase complex dihydrolipoamide acyltransferase (E2) component
MHEPLAVVVPQLNPNDDSAVLVRWHVTPGLKVKSGQPLATLETTKTTFDVSAPSDGYVFFDCALQSVVAVGTSIAWISSQNTPPAIKTKDDTAITPASKRDSRFTRKALRLMQQHGLRASDFEGSGRIDVDAVERVTQQRASQSGRAIPRDEEVEALEQSASKIIEVRTLSEVYRGAIASTVSMSLSAPRTQERLRSAAEVLGGPLSLLELAIYEVARILADFPDFNCYYADDRAWHHKTVAIGFAINLGNSLRVPVVHAADQLSQLEIARLVRDLSLRYMRNELTIQDLTGGTFTITDLSSLDVVHFVPVLNARQSAILGICAERSGAGSRDLVLTFDHRVTDGMRAALFLAKLRERIEAGSSSS